jgi:hypothetical protein
MRALAPVWGDNIQLKKQKTVIYLLRYKQYGNFGGSKAKKKKNNSGSANIFENSCNPCTDFSHISRAVQGYRVRQF